jgi:thioredoxin 1
VVNKNWVPLIPVIALLTGVLVAKAYKSRAGTPVTPTARETSSVPSAVPESSTVPEAENAAADVPTEGLPRLIELGSTGCVPCEHMAPIIESLRAELKGKVAVEFINVGEHPEAIDKYAIQTIPVQVFVDASGKELLRHTGVFEKDEILAKLRELGMLSQ